MNNALSGLLGGAAFAALVGSLPGCTDATPSPQPEDRSIMTFRENGIDKVDLLLVIDNSPSSRCSSSP